MYALNFVLWALAAMAIGLLFMGISRKLTARLQRRYGPPFWQSFIDVIKAFSRKSISHNFIMDLCALMGLAGLLAAAMYVPMGGILPFPSDSPLILILYFMPIGYLGMAVSVSASGNPLASIGIGRALTLMLGYEIPFAIVVMSFISNYGTTNILSIMQAQAGGIENWHIIKMPFGFLASLLALEAMTGKKPFDVMIAPAEIASGPMVELSGKFLGLAFLQYSVAVFVETGLLTALFLGGGATVWEFVLKQFIVYMVLTLFSEIYARYRVEQAVRFLWIYAGGLAVIQLALNMYMK